MNGSNIQKLPNEKFKYKNTTKPFEKTDNKTHCLNL